MSEPTPLETGSVKLVKFLVNSTMVPRATITRVFTYWDEGAHKLSNEERDAVLTEFVGFKNVPPPAPDPVSSDMNDGFRN